MFVAASEFVILTRLIAYIASDKVNEFPDPFIHVLPVSVEYRHVVAPEPRVIVTVFSFELFTGKVTVGGLGATVSIVKLGSVSVV